MKLNFSFSFCSSWACKFRKKRKISFFKVPIVTRLKLSNCCSVCRNWRRIEKDGKEKKNKIKSVERSSPAERQTNQSKGPICKKL